MHPKHSNLQFSDTCVPRNMTCTPTCFKSNTTCPNGAHNESCVVLWPSNVKANLPPHPLITKAKAKDKEVNVFGQFANFNNDQQAFEGFLSVVVYGKKFVYCARE